MGGILDVVIDVLRQNEDKGLASLESLIELSSSHGEIWSKVAPKLIFVVSEIMKNSNFENSTRQSALEIISTLAEDMPALLRKNQNELKTHFFPSVMHMLTEVEFEDDLNAWAEVAEEEMLAKNDPSSVAADALNRLSSFLGEKTIIACTTHIVKEAIESVD